MLDTATPETCGLDSDLLAAALKQLAAQHPELHGVLVARHGQIVLDAHAPGQSSHERHIINSCTKSVLAALIGIAIEQGLFAVDDRILTLLPDFGVEQQDVRWNDITVHHLLTMSSGIDWPQYGPDNISDAMGRSEDWIRFILQRPMAAAPGTVCNYSNGDSHLLSAILQQATGKTALDFGLEALFAPLGITDLEWMTDPQGRSIGSATLYLRPRDMAKIGLLYLNRGQWQGRQIVPSRWIELSWQLHAQMPTWGGPADYGYYWWLYPEQGLCEAWGGAGQRIAVLASNGVVVVITADNPDDSPRSESASAFYANVVNLATSSNALPPNPSAMVRLAQAQTL